MISPSNLPINDIRGLPPAKYLAGENRVLITSQGQTYNAISNGIQWCATSCAHVGTFASLPDPTTVLAGAPAVVTDLGFALYINTGTAWSPDGLVSGTATLDFGTGAGSQEASVVVTGQSSILSTSQVILTVKGDSTSSNRSAKDHRYFQLFAELTYGAIVPGTGFTIYGTSSDQLTGRYTITWQWS